MSLDRIVERQRKQLRTLGIAFVVLGLLLAGGGVQEVVTNGDLAGEYFSLAIAFVAGGIGSMLRSRR